MQTNKSKVAAGLLALFLGSIGVHNFYLGNTKLGVMKLCITLGLNILNFILVFLLIPVVPFICTLGVWAMAVWALIDAIMIFTGKTNTDEAGNPLV